MNTLPPLPSPAASLTAIFDLPSTRTGPKPVTVGTGPLRGFTGTSPTPAALVTCTVPAGACSTPPLIVTGPPTSPSVPPAGVPSVAPFTVTGRGLGVRNPKAAGGAEVSVLASGLVAWKRAPS